MFNSLLLNKLYHSVVKDVIRNIITADFADVRLKYNQPFHLRISALYICKYVSQKYHWQCSSC